MRKGLWLLLVLAACERQPARPPQQTARASALPADLNQRMDALVRDDLDASLAYSPTTATWMGVHVYDDRIDDVRPDAQVREATRLRALLERLHQIDPEKLDAQHRIDFEILERRTQAALWE